MGLGAAEKEVTFLGCGAGVSVFDFCNGLGCSERGGNRQVRHPFLPELGKVGKVDEVTPRWSRGPTAKPCHALSNVARKTRPRLLTVIADINPGGELLIDHAFHRLFDLTVEFPFVDMFPALLANQQVQERTWPWETAGVCGENALLAALHRVLL